MLTLGKRDRTGSEQCKQKAHGVNSKQNCDAPHTEREREGIWEIGRIALGFFFFFYSMLLLSL